MNAVVQTRQTIRQLLRQASPHGMAGIHMAIDVQIHGRLAHMALSGYFGFQSHREFVKSYLPLLDNTAVDEIWVGMIEVDYLDSSALGMLLLLNERAIASNKPITLIAASGAASRTLEITNFSKVFKIRHVPAGNYDLPNLFSVMNRSVVAS